MRPGLGLYILDDQGEPFPIDNMSLWSNWMESHFAERVVAKTDIAQWHVSTVFLAIDHSFGLGGDPVLWETMVFGPPPWDEFQKRYISKGAALADHDQVVATIRDGLSPDWIP